MFQNLTGWHALIILGIIVLIFGAAKLPALARSVGQSMRILRSESQTPTAEVVETTAVPVADAEASGAEGSAAPPTRPRLTVAE